MKITGGYLKGRTIQCPPGIIRPATSRMRESMFSILGNIDGLSFLDLFSGSGIVALEAGSRGATPLLIVEKDRQKRPTLLNNLSLFTDPETSQQARTISWTVKMAPVSRILQPGLTPHDLVFLDPPFAFRNKQHLLELCDRAGQPAPGGTLLLHHPSGETLPESCGTLKRYDRRKYGGSVLDLYTRQDS